MLTIHLKGGLGNQLFQLAALETIAKETNRSFILRSLITPPTHHSSQNYLQTIFRNWNNYYKISISSYQNVSEQNPYVKENWNQKLTSSNTCLEGYFQNYEYVSNTFCSKLIFNTSVLSKYPTIQKCAFLHIRGGDYVNHWLHDVKLDNYYKEAIEKFSKDTHFYVFTNDIEYAKTKKFLKDIQYSFVQEKEEDSLYLMSQCGFGGICANSSFSWWGAYLNRNRLLILPSKWFNDLSYYTKGFYFDGCTIIDV